jgi:hypothetical protein
LIDIVFIYCGANRSIPWRFCRWINYQIMGRVQTVLFRDAIGNSDHFLRHTE